MQRELVNFTIEEGKIEEVKRIIKLDNRLLNYKNEKGRSLVFIAAMEGHKDILSYLISEGSNIHTSNKAGNTPLVAAVVKNHPDCVRLLVEEGANPNSIYKHRRATMPIYNYAVFHNLTECSEILRRTSGINLEFKDSVGISGYEINLFAKDKGSPYVKDIQKRLTIRFRKRNRGRSKLFNKIIK